MFNLSEKQATMHLECRVSCAISEKGYSSNEEGAKFLERHVEWTNMGMCAAYLGKPLWKRNVSTMAATLLKK